jgi:CRISPR-associated protein Cas1
MLNEFVYCQRLFYLEWVQGQFAESADTLEGTFAHRGTQKPHGNLDSDIEDANIKSVYLSGPYSRLVAKIDVVESEDGHVVPVEYKKGRVPDNPESS